MVTLNSFNDFMSEDHQKRAEDELKSFGLKKAGALFFKKLETSLNLCLLDILPELTRGESSVKINVKAMNSKSAKQDGLQVSLPAPGDMCLPQINYLTTTHSKGATLCTKAFGVSQLDWSGA